MRLWQCCLLPFADLGPILTTSPHAASVKNLKAAGIQPANRCPRPACHKLREYYAFLCFNLQTILLQEFQDEVKHFSDLPMSEQTKKGHRCYLHNHTRAQLACRTEKGVLRGNDGYTSKKHTHFFEMQGCTWSGRNWQR